MEIYLIRHTTPAIEKGICYGQSDIYVQNSFVEEANEIKRFLPAEILKVYSSPLKRCKKLAEFLFPNIGIEYNENLKEINCGTWEKKRWDEINQSVLDPWMKDFVNVCFPGGENFLELAKRVNKIFEAITNCGKSPVAVVTHAGVIRSILCFISNTPLEQAFTIFKSGFGSIVWIQRTTESFIFKMIN